MNRDNIAIWEYLDEFWKMFSVKMCQNIEDGYQNYRQGSSANRLKLPRGSIDFKTMEYSSQQLIGPGTIRRVVLPGSSLLARNHTWQWKYKNAWENYTAEVNQLIEDHANWNKHQPLNLSQYDPTLMYIIYINDQKSGVQQNKNTGYQRKIRKERFSFKFPTTTDKVTSSLSNPATNSYTTTPTHQQASSARQRRTASRNTHHSSQSSQHYYSNTPLYTIQPATAPSASYTTNSHHSSQSSQHHYSNTLSYTTQPGTTPSYTTNSHHSNPRATSFQNIFSTDPYSSTTNTPALNAINSSSGGKQGLLDKFSTTLTTPPSDDCVICMTSLSDVSGFQTSGATNQASSVIELKTCKHIFHAECLIASMQSGANDSFTCPCCKVIYGVKTGNQPPGQMHWSVIQTSVPGYEPHHTIRITYDIRAGMQTNEHPNPGRRYSVHGFPRIAYLPDNTDGNKVLRLLEVAWNRKLIFTVGDSVTSGAKDTVTWNEIHHKTSITNKHGHGYPDPNYLTNVLNELKAQGVSEDDLK
uniref:E3 ubiquitin-protein ligase n=1 Tax=Ciona intestinalis TaxID=7719 RepID=H2XSL2_CIOIN|nr:deltex protein isoform X1 [Ciona intestinalis]|eukprot:XP_026692305.1 deltex protein isoform X1 [Ciona intestinalis]